MEISIDIDNSVPLFAQLIGQIKKAVLCDKIAPGDALPSIRQLANDLELNNKTVAKAYRLLELDSVIQTKGSRGTFVNGQAKTTVRLMAEMSLARNIHDTLARIDHRFGNEGDFGRPERFSESFAIDPVQVE